MRRAVVVLPLVPVMTIAPCSRVARKLAQKRRGRLARATSPGRVVPPPSRLIRDSAPVALPCPHRCGAPHQAQAPTLWVTAVQQSSDATAACASCFVANRLKKADPLPVICHSEPRLSANALTRLSARSAARRRRVGGLAPGFVPRTVNGGGREFDTRPADGEPGGFSRLRCETVACALSQRASAGEEKRHVSADGRRRSSSDPRSAREAFSRPATPWPRPSWLLQARRREGCVCGGGIGSAARGRRPLRVRQGPSG